MTELPHQPGLNRLIVRKLTASAGTVWIKIAYDFYKRNPLLWIKINLAYFLILMLISMIPYVGPLLVPLLNPIFIAGLMVACHDAQFNRNVDYQHLFKLFKSKVSSPLVTTGGIYLVALVISMVFMGSGNNLSSMNVDPNNPATIPLDLNNPQTGFRIIVVFAILIIGFMMNFFAPLLILFKNMRAVDALKISLIATWKNILPLMVFGLLIMGIIITISIPFFMIITALKLQAFSFLFAVIITMIVMPLYHISMYTAYRTIFSDLLNIDTSQDDLNRDF